MSSGRAERPERPATRRPEGGEVVAEVNEPGAVIRRGEGHAAGQSGSSRCGSTGKENKILYSDRSVSILTGHPPSIVTFELWKQHPTKARPPSRGSAGSRQEIIASIKMIGEADAIPDDAFFQQRGKRSSPLEMTRWTR
jgi:hypothetical protein